MPMPHADMKKLIQRRLKGTDGTERLRVARECMAMLPGYKQGPYADLRKWLSKEMETTKKRRDVRHADGAFVPREGDARIVLLGPPNAGKSSLLKSLCGSSVQVGDYAFTTLRPIAATAIINEARIQMVEIPGLIEGAREDRGSGRMYLGAAQDADGYLLLMPLAGEASEEPDLSLSQRMSQAQSQAQSQVQSQVQSQAQSQGSELDEGFEKFQEEVVDILQGRPFIVVGTKADLPGADRTLEAASSRFRGHSVVPVSTATGQGLDDLREAIWEMTGLMRVYSKQSEGRPFIVRRGMTVEGLAAYIHHELASELDRAAVWGPSAKFPGQVVGRDHVLSDTDSVKLFKRKS